VALRHALRDSAYLIYVQRHLRCRRYLLLVPTYFRF
jgi:hypothetical protein